MAGYEAYLKELLAPLGVYDLSDGSLSESELFAAGAGLDGVAARLENAERESLVPTAEDEGLRRREALFARKPVSPGVAQRRQAIAALMRIGGDCFSLNDINSTISGCGIKALAQETDEYGHIRVVFPETAGEPEGYEQIKKIVLDIIPCHLETEFYLRYMLWSECESYGWTWEMAEQAEHTWYSFELAV